MSKKLFRRIFPAVLALLTALSLCPLAAAAADISPVVTSYKSSSSRITLGCVSDFEIHIKDTSVAAADVPDVTTEIDVTKLIDSFDKTDATVISVEPDASATGTQLAYTVKMTRLKYSGTGSKLSFMVGYLGTYTTLEVNIFEAVQYEPTEEEPYIPEALPEPTVLIHRGDISPVEAGQEFEVKITFENLSNLALSNPVVTYSPSSPLILTGGSSSFALEKIGAKKSLTTTVKLKVSGEVSSENLSLGVDLKYTYYNNVSTVSGSASDRVNIPAVLSPTQSETPVSAPEVIVSRGEMSAPAEAGTEFDVELVFTNLGDVELKNPILSCSPSDPLIVAGGSSSFLIDNIPAGGNGSATVRLKAIGDITSPNLTLTANLKFTYAGGSSTSSGTASGSVNLPAIVTKHEQSETVSIPEPPVIITRSPISPISAGSSFQLEITFKNAGDTPVVRPVVSFSTSEALILQNDTSTVVLSDIPAGESCSVKLDLKAANEINSTTQSVGADMKFYYNNGSTLVQSSASERVTIPSNITEPKQDETHTDSPVPNLIISEFGFGGDSVAAGEPFDLSFTFKNTGKLAVENIVVVVDGGESFTMNGSTNTFYYETLGAKSAQTQIVPMQTLAAARTGAQTVNVSFRYEYVDGDRRSSSSSDIKLSVPVFQPDRLQIDEPTLYGMAYAGTETTLVMGYVNKGKSDMSNVEVSIAGDVDALQQTQYLGNFASGQSGNISFVVTPWQAGETELLITVTYEDANMQTVTREFPFTLDVQEMDWGWEEPIYPDEPMEEEGSKGPGIWLWIGIGAAVLAAAVITALAVKKHKKKAAAVPDDGGWDDWGSGGKEE